MSGELGAPQTAGQNKPQVRDRQKSESLLRAKVGIEIYIVVILLASGTIGSWWSKVIFK